MREKEYIHIVVVVVVVVLIELRVYNNNFILFENNVYQRRINQSIISSINSNFVIVRRFPREIDEFETDAKW